MIEILRREAVYLWYYFSVQLGQIFWYWVLGMVIGSAASFMLTGPATKITNLGALKIVLGIKNFIIYLLFVMAFSFAAGIIVNIVI